MPILLEDIYSVAKGRKLYGKKGEKVKIVADFVNVVIVELRGERFPVSKKKIAE